AVRREPGRAAVAGRDDDQRFGLRDGQALGRVDDVADRLDPAADIVGVRAAAAAATAAATTAPPESPSVTAAAAGVIASAPVLVAVGALVGRVARLLVQRPDADNRRRVGVALAPRGGARRAGAKRQR